MAIDPVLTQVLTPEVLTSQERWRRWEERGRDNDVRFMRQVRRMFWSGVVVMTVILIFSLLS